MERIFTHIVSQIKWGITSSNLPGIQGEEEEDDGSDFGVDIDSEEEVTPQKKKSK